MKLNKIQKEIFNALLGTGQIVSFSSPDGKTAYSVNGFKAFILPDEIVCFSRDKVKCSEQTYEPLVKGTDDKLLKVTNELKIIRGKTMSRKLICAVDGETMDLRDGKSSEIWIDNSFLDYFVNATFYASNVLGRVLVTEPPKNEPCAILMPMRVE